MYDIATSPHVGCVLPPPIRSGTPHSGKRTYENLARLSCMLWGPTVAIAIIVTDRLRMDSYSEVPARNDTGPRCAKDNPTS